MALELVVPDAARHEAWLAGHREWGPGRHEDGFGIGPDDEVESVEGFEAWVHRLHGRTSARMWWIVDGDAVLGGVALRLGGDQVARLGHVGYGVRPTARGRGVATWALGEVLGRARGLGLPRLLVVCRDDNPASIATIERHGGALEAVVDEDHGRVRRYWIGLADRPSSAP